MPIFKVRKPFPNMRSMMRTTTGQRHFVKNYELDSIEKHFSNTVSYMHLTETSGKYSKNPIKNIVSWFKAFRENIRLQG